MKNITWHGSHLGLRIRIFSRIVCNPPKTTTQTICHVPPISPYLLHTPILSPFIYIYIKITPKKKEKKIVSFKKVL